MIVEQKQSIMQIKNDAKKTKKTKQKTIVRLFKRLSAELEKSVHNYIPCTINVQGSRLDEKIVWHTVVSERFHNSQIENDINYRHVFA